MFLRNVAIGGKFTTASSKAFFNVMTRICCAGSCFFSEFFYVFLFIQAFIFGTSHSACDCGWVYSLICSINPYVGGNFTFDINSPLLLRTHSRYCYFQLIQPDLEFRFIFRSQLGPRTVTKFTYLSKDCYSQLVLNPRRSKIQRPKIAGLQVYATKLG